MSVGAQRPPEDSASHAAETPDTAGFKLLLDVPSREPRLGFATTAEALAQIVMESDPQFAVGIFGGWGSGKTTLMRAIEDRLDPDRVVSVQFNAWRYEKEEHLIVPLLDTIREALLAWGEEHREDGGAAKDTAATIGRVTRSILAGVSVRVGLPHALELSFDANKALTARREFRTAELDARVPRSFYHASFRALTDAFSGFAGSHVDRRIVVFVDDLDRCQPESALQVLESMKLFFDLHGFVFVVGLDREVVEHVIDLKYGRQTAAEAESDSPTRRASGEEYIEKIFQLPYRLKPVVQQQINEFVAAAYDEAGLPDEQRADLERATPHLHYLVGDSNVNPREIKRFLNAYIVQRRIDPALDPDVILTIQTIRSRREWRKVYDALLAYRQFFVDALQAGTLSRLDPELEAALPEDFFAYVGPYEPGHAFVERKDIEQYVASAEALRSTQEPRLVSAIGYVGEVRQHLTDAAAPGSATDDERRASLRKAQEAMSGVEMELEFAPGTTAGKARFLRDIEAYRAMTSRLIESGWPAEPHEAELEELSRLARAMAERLFRIYRTGEPPRQAARR